MRTIIVFYDSLNKRFLPPYNPDCDTIAPNFERLAQKAVTFDNSYVGSMPCIPARRELHTGRHNFLHREWGPLEPFDDSMPEILKKHGVYTHLISDHLHYWEDGGCNFHARYSSWEVVRGQEGDHWKAEIKDPQIPEVVFVPKKQTGEGVSGLWRYDWINRKYIIEEKDFPQTQVFDRGCEFIEKNQDQDNWLLDIETFDPHEPFYVPQEYLDLYPEDYDGKHFDWPRGQVDQSEAEVNHCRRQYKALVSMCDKNLGRVLDMMDRYNMWEDTMLIVGTDHGFLLGEHGWWGKNQMPYYNEVANNPLFIWDPRCKKQGEHRQSLVQLIDWAPTILNFHGLEVPKDMQGYDLSKVIEKDEKVRDTAIYGVFSGHVNITDGQYSYMRSAVKGRENEVYNYTLVPQHMTERFKVKELQDVELREPFTFTKGCSVLKIKAKENYKVSQFGNLLFDLKDDPAQLKPIRDAEAEKRLIAAMIAKMRENDAPEEQFYRLGLTD